MFPGQPDSNISAAAEVAQVVELILEHAETRPEHSLGVIAMGIKHADRIDEALRLALHDRNDLEDFFDESQQEPFFVKNLERVQGDERDAIILSVGYGKNAEGRLLYRFGPLNQEGGERRLNVAVTRAKERMTLVSSFTHQDMDPDRSSAQGVKLLRAYIDYCSSNGANLGEAASEIPELNPFEIDIRDSLVRAGIPLSAQYGASGYRIDFAAKHPTLPGRMVLAIECDGASYHSSPTARDRDRLRQEQLERLGWTFHRIWSQDWFNDKAGEISKCGNAYVAAVSAADAEDEDEESGGNGHSKPDPREGGSGGHGIAIHDSDSVSPISDPGPAQVRGRATPPINIRPGFGIDDYSQGQLVHLIKWIEADGRLRTRVQLFTEVMQELGFKRRGAKISARIDEAIHAVRGP